MRIKHFFSILLTIMSFNLFAQTWSEPVNITPDEYHDSFPDICIDNNGVLHCVWVKTFSSGYKCIYYSKSLNQGTTWNPPEKVSPQDSGAAHQPYIECDEFNNLYVVYKYDINDPYNENYYFMIFNGQNWTTPVTICDELPGAFMEEMCIDNNDRIYVFWRYFDHKPHYRYYENGQWSNYFTLYSNYTESLHIRKSAPDSYNNLHSIGSYLDETNDTAKAAYFYYDYEDNQWSEPIILGMYDHTGGFEDIAVDSYDNPNLVWSEQHFMTTGMDATLYKNKTNNGWSETEIIVENTEGLVLQEIDIVDNQKLIVDMEDLGTSYDMTLYRQDYSGNWYGSVIFNDYRVSPYSLLHDSDNLYILFLRQQYSGDWLDVFITSTSVDSLVTGLINNELFSPIRLTVSQNFPNPFISETKIGFHTNCDGEVKIVISDINTKEIGCFYLGHLNAGDHSITWNGTNHNNTRLQTGTYFYTVIINDIQITKHMILLE